MGRRRTRRRGRSGGKEEEIYGEELDEAGEVTVFSMAQLKLSKCADVSSRRKFPWKRKLTPTFAVLRILPEGSSVRFMDSYAYVHMVVASHP